MGDVAGELDHFQAALHLTQSIVDRLPVLGGEQLGEFHLPGGNQLAECEHHVLTLRQGGKPPGLEGFFVPCRTARSTSSAEPSATSPVCSPVAGL